MSVLPTLLAVNRAESASKLWETFEYLLELINRIKSISTGENKAGVVE